MKTYMITQELIMALENNGSGICSNGKKLVGKTFSDESGSLESVLKSEGVSISDAFDALYGNGGITEFVDDDYCWSEEDEEGLFSCLIRVADVFGLDLFPRDEIFYHVVGEISKEQIDEILELGGSVMVTYDRYVRIASRSGEVVFEEL